MEEQERDVPGASSPPPRGERITLCSPAMSLVLAEMAQADAAEEACGDTATAAVGTLPKGITCRALPSMQQLRDARLPSRPSSPTREHTGGASSRWAMRGWSEAWCCASSPHGRIVTAVLAWLPWSQRSVCAMEYAAMAPLFMQEKAEDRAQLCLCCAESSCEACCARDCSPITKSDCADGAVLAATAVCVIRAAARVLGCGRESLGCFSHRPPLPSLWSRLAQKSSCLAPVALVALALSCLGASYRLSLMRTLSKCLMDAESAQQQAQTICKLRVALSLGLTATANGTGKLPPVSRLDKWMSRGSSNGLERSALQALRGALVQYLRLLQADGLGLLEASAAACACVMPASGYRLQAAPVRSGVATGPDVALNGHGTDRIRLVEIQGLRDEQAEVRSRALRTLLAHLHAQHPAVFLLSCAARSSCARAHPRAISQLAADIHAVTVALGQDLSLQVGGRLPARPPGVLAGMAGVLVGMARVLRRGLPGLLLPSDDAACLSAGLPHETPGAGAHVLVRHSLALALDMQARAGAGLTACLAAASQPRAPQLGHDELQGMAAACDEAREQLMHALACVATARDSLQLELSRARRAGGALETGHARAAPPSLDLTAAAVPETGESELAERGQRSPGVAGGRSGEDGSRRGVEIVFLSHDDKLSACPSPDEEGEEVPHVLLGPGVPHDLMRKLQALRGSRSSSSSSSSASAQRDGGEDGQEAAAGAPEDAGGSCEALHREPAGALAGEGSSSAQRAANGGSEGAEVRTGTAERDYNGGKEERARGLQPSAPKPARNRQRQGLAALPTRPPAAMSARHGCAEFSLAVAVPARSDPLAAASTAHDTGQGLPGDALADGLVQRAGEEVAGAPGPSSRGRYAYVEELEGVLRGRPAAARMPYYVQ